MSSDDSSIPIELQFPEKCCSKCKETKPRIDFAKHKRNRDGLDSQCKACHAAYSKGYRQQSEVKERRRFTDAAYRERNRERLRERDRLRKKERYHSNPEYREKLLQQRKTEEYRIKENDRKRRRYRENPKIKERTRLYRKTEKAKATKYAYSQRPEAKAKQLEYIHRPEIKEKRRLAWLTEEGRERRRVYTQNRRARKKQTGGSFTQEDVKRMVAQQKGKCWWCGGDISEYYEIDHRIAISRGGSSDPSNLVLSCLSCNRKKHNKLPHEWSDRLL